MLFNSPYFQVLFAGLIWGTNGIFIKKIHLNVIALAAIRLIIPTLGTWIYLHFKGINVWKKWRKWMIVASSLNAFRVVLYFTGFSLTSVGNGILVLYTWPLFVTFFASIFLKEKLTKFFIFLMLMAMAGIVIIESSQPFSWQSHDVWGMLVMGITAIITSWTVIIYKAESAYYSQVEGVFFQNAVGAILALPLLPWIFTTIPIWKIGFTSAYSFVAGLLGFALFFSALAKISSTHVSLLAYFEVVVTVITGLVWLHEPLTPNLVMGGTLIITALILSQTRLQKISKKIREP